MKRRSSSAISAEPKNVRRSIFVEGIRAQTNLSSGTFRWDRLLDEVQQMGTYPMDRVVPVSAFGNPALGEFYKVMPSSGLRLEIRHEDYKQQLGDIKQTYWIAEVKELVGFYLLLRYEGMDEEGDERDDFWANIGSDDVKNVGYCSKHDNCELLPPRKIAGRKTDWREYIVTKLNDCKTLTGKWVRERQLSLVEGRFKIGTRLELLDRLYSSRVRPARVIEQLGRRICVQVCQEDVDKQHWAEAKREDAQVRTGIWCDESYELIFPVGWARANGYGLLANAEYVEHCSKIVQALKHGKRPEYDKLDASPDIFNDWKENVAEDKGGERTIHWQVGMKFECLDPLNQSFLELKVATCLALLTDGYLRIGFDGPDVEEDAMPIHCTSPFLFPANYAAEHGIALSGPKETEGDFSWPDYLRQCQAIRAPNALFDPLPSAAKLQYFKVGAKLEATDQCEPNLVCPATICAIRGRLLQVHFDGWESEMDQLFDYRSRELFPIGWCEMYGYKLEAPKGYDLSKKKMRTIGE
ncbi:hypothetical protein niasHT_027031 [Heterodera trifolii]|uniref:Mbt repeat protein n=1 Tax=Heterodera trifolii TaxID=157864 RepID=A0ABD2JT93_9BILA